ncbi:heparinase II/III-family protein [Myxococcota bacterium]|nr:heparinase II/III-family protein [Myxococcota bacterium]
MGVLERAAFGVWRKARSLAGRGFVPAQEPVSPVDCPLGRVPSLGAQLPSDPPAAAEALLDSLLRAGAPTALTPAQARALHRHVWWPGLARAAACGGGPERVEPALRALGEWIAADRPGQGPAWEHGSDAALRLLSWGLAVAWQRGQLPDTLRRRLAGSAEAHLQYTLAVPALAEGPADHRPALQAAGLAVGGLLFPELPSARRARAEGLSRLGHAIDAMTSADGAPRCGSPGALLLAVEAALVARAYARAARVPTPALLDGALLRAAWFLRVLGDGFGGLPNIGERPAPSLLGGASPWLNPWVTLCALGLSPGESAPEGAADPVVGLLTGKEPPAPGPQAERGKTWSMVSFRDAGWVVAHAEVKGGLSRAVVLAADHEGLWGHPDGGQVLWDLPKATVLADPGAWAQHPELAEPEAHGGVFVGERRLRAALETARVDGRDATVTLRLSGDGGGPGGGLIARRELKLAGARLSFTDRFEGEGAAPFELRWPLGPGWTLTRAEKGFEGSHPQAKLSVAVDGEADWSVEAGEVLEGDALVSAPVLVARGRAAPGQRLKTRFEIK